MHFLEGLDVGAGRFEDAQAEQPEHGHQGEVVDVGRLFASAEHGLELEVIQAECRGLGGDAWTANVFGWRVVEEPVDDAGAVETGHHREATRNRRWLVATYLLHPAEEQLDMGPANLQGVQSLPAAPVEEGAQV
jgi:hypothetical protein